jgi:hypothetical protein
MSAVLPVLLVSCIKDRLGFSINEPEYKRLTENLEEHS